MSQTKSLHRDERVKAGNFGKKMMTAGFALALLFGLASVFFGMGVKDYLGHYADGGDHWRRFMHAYVTAWSFVTSISVGALFFVIIHFLVRARWSTVVRRLAEGMANAMPVLAIAGLVFIIPLVAGYKDLYYWAHGDAHNHELNHHLAGKLGWLDPAFFAVRYGIYMIGFSALAAYFGKKSRQQDESGDPKITETLRIAAGPGVIIYALVTIFFSFDILMSLAPKWYSTIYPVNYFGGAMVATFSVLILLSLIVQRSGRLTNSITVEHYHDLGKWLFAWTFFWAYTAFSQFMLIWYANIPEETIFYKYRFFTDWQPVSIVLAICHFALPFVLLMTRWTKRILPILAFLAAWQLVFHWLDLYWNVMPNYNWTYFFTESGAKFFEGPLAGNLGAHPVGFSPVDITTMLAMFGVFLIGVGKALHGNLIPVKDPTLKHSLAFENF